MQGEEEVVRERRRRVERKEDRGRGGGGWGEGIGKGVGKERGGKVVGKEKKEALGKANVVLEIGGGEGEKVGMLGSM